MQVVSKVNRILARKVRNPTNRLRKKIEINEESKKTIFTPARFKQAVQKRVPNRFFGIWDFPYLKLGIKDFKAKSGRDSELKVCEGGLLKKKKITNGIARSLESGLRD